MMRAPATRATCAPTCGGDAAEMRAGTMMHGMTAVRDDDAASGGETRGEEGGGHQMKSGGGASVAR